MLKQKTGRTIPILVTEAGFHGFSNEQLGAEYVTALYNQAKTVPFLEGIWWYQLEDHKAGFGLLRSNNTKKPPFAAFQAAAE